MDKNSNYKCLHIIGKTPENSGSFYQLPSQLVLSLINRIEQKEQ